MSTDLALAAAQGFMTRRTLENGVVLHRMSRTAQSRRRVIHYRAFLAGARVAGWTRPDRPGNAGDGDVAGDYGVARDVPYAAWLALVQALTPVTFKARRGGELASVCGRFHIRRAAARDRPAWAPAGHALWVLHDAQAVAGSGEERTVSSVLEAKLLALSLAGGAVQA